MEGRIKLTIDKLGRPTMVGEGFVGTVCDEKMRPLEDAFRGAKMTRENTPEYYMTEDATSEQQVTL